MGTNTIEQHATTIPDGFVQSESAPESIDNNRIELIGQPLTLSDFEPSDSFVQKTKGGRYAVTIPEGFMLGKPVPQLSNATTPMKDMTDEDRTVLEDTYNEMLLKKYPRDLYSGVPHWMDAFAQGILPIRPTETLPPGLEKQHPVAFVAGKIAGLAAMSSITAGIEPALAMRMSKVSPLLPYLSRAVPKIAQRMALWGGKELVDQLSRLFAGEEKTTGEIVGKAAKEAAFGIVSGAASGVGATGTRILSQAAVRGAWTAMEELVEKGDLDGESAVAISLNAVLGAAVEAINAKAVTRAYKAREAEAWSNAYARARIMRTHPEYSEEQIKNSMGLINEFSMKLKPPVQEYVLKQMPKGLSNVEKIQVSAKFADSLTENISKEGANISDVVVGAVKEAVLAVRPELAKSTKEISDVDISDLEEISNLASNAQPNAFVKTEEGYTRLAGGMPANFLKGETQKGINTILDKIKSGKELTKKQSEKLQSLLGGYRDEVKPILEEWTNVKKEISESEATEAIRSANKTEPIVEQDIGWGGEEEEIIAPTPTEGKVEKQEFSIEPSKAETDFMETETADLQKKMDSEKGAVEMSAVIQGVVNAYKKAHDWVFSFGEMRRTNKDMYNAFQSAFAERNAGIEKSIDTVTKIVEGREITMAEDMTMAMVYENKELSVQDSVKDVYDQLADLNNQIEKASLAEGIITEPFHERMIRENLEKIDKIKSQVKYPDKSKRIKALLEENKKLENFRYLPHDTVVKRAIELKISKMKDGKEKDVFIEKASRLSARFKQRKGKKFLQEYFDEGLLKPEDVSFRKLTMENLASYYYRSSMQKLYKYAEDRGYILPATEELENEGWYNTKEIGITAPELKGKLIHPLVADGLIEIKEMRTGHRGNVFRQMLGVFKVAQFITPQIILVYDGIQKIFRGLFSLNPLKEAGYLAKSVRIVAKKTDDYHKFNENNLYQFPYETPRAAKEEAIKMAVRQTSKEIPDFVKKLESITNMSWAKGDVSPVDLLMAAYKAIANVTWVGDKIIRTSSVLALQDMGYDTPEACQIAGRGHGAYSDLSTKFKKTMSPIVFVHSFRVLMPIEMTKVIQEPVEGVLRAKAGKKKIPKRDLERWAKAIIGTLIIPVAVDFYMKARGFERDKAGWKWKKTVTQKNGDKAEVVVGINYILNMPVKYWHRLTSYNPINPTMRPIQGIFNLLKWEVHPAWRGLQDIAENRRSFGAGETVYDPNDLPPKQIADSMKYYFGQMFRLHGKMMDAAEAGNITIKEQKDNEEIIGQALTGFDKFMFGDGKNSGLFGYTYVRKDQTERKKLMSRYLKKEYGKRKWNIKTKYEGEQAEKRLEKLDAWEKRCRQWIAEDMK